MGLANASQSYQRWMDAILEGMEGTYCYLDDILVYSKSEQQHKDTLKQVFQRLICRSDSQGILFALRISKYLLFIVDMSVQKGSVDKDDRRYIKI